MPTAEIVAVILCLQTKAISSACIILSTRQPRHQGRISWHPGEPTNILHMKKQQFLGTHPQNVTFSSDIYT